MTTSSANTTAPDKLLPLLRPWTWVHKIPSLVLRETVELAGEAWRNRKILRATTLVEFRRKYAANILGWLWAPLYSLLFLAMYGFVFLFVFRASHVAFTQYEYMVFIFCGLVPYFGFADALNSATGSVRANIGLIQNTVFPAELIPLRQLLVSSIGLSMSLGILVVLVLPTGFLGWHMLYLPVSFLLLLLASLGLAWLMSGIAALVPDVSHLVQLVTLGLLFTSPIAFQLSQVDGPALVVAYANPLTYLIESFRFSILGMRDTPLWTDAVVAGVALPVAALSGAFFKRLKPLFADHE